MFVFRDAAVSSGGPGESFFTERAQSTAHRVLIKVHERVAVGFLVARVNEGVQGKRIVFGRGDFLFDETAQHSRFDFSQNDIHGTKSYRKAHNFPNRPAYVPREWRNGFAFYDDVDWHSFDRRRPYTRDAILLGNQQAHLVESS